MKKRGQWNLRIVFIFLLSLFILIGIILSVGSFGDLKQGVEEADIINLKTSIQTEILQQSVKPESSVSRATIAIPGSVEEICFFDSSKDFERLKNPELTTMFSDDEINKLFIKTREGYLSYPLSKANIESNPMCLKAHNNKVALDLVSTNQETKIIASETEDVKCITVLGNGDPDDKVDIVFLGYGFESTDDYNEQINRYVNNIILEFEPYKDYKDKFNFYRKDNSDIECEIGSFIKCDQFEIKREAADCPHDFIVLLVARSSVKDFLQPVRSSAIGNIAKINTADKPFVLIHEMGHSFGDLADEYVDENYYSSQNFNPGDYVNCDYTGCDSWKGADGTSCYPGCSLGRFFRPTQNSIMRSLSSTSYGPLNEKEIIKRLLYYE